MHLFARAVSAVLYIGRVLLACAAADCASGCVVQCCAVTAAVVLALVLLTVWPCGLLLGLYCVFLNKLNP
jgi:hypothetical protein